MQKHNLAAVRAFNKFILHFLIIMPILIIIISQSIAARDSQTHSWQTWLSEFREEALADGIAPSLFDRIFKDIQPKKKLIRLDRSQPEKRLTFLKYRKSRVNNYRIVLGRKKYIKNKSTINNIAQQYGINPCMIVALWGMESSYGHYVGHFNVIRSLATLAFDKRRAEFFRKELLIALHILDEGHITFDKFVGEWAGGTGQPQFLPSSWKRYAVDYDHDGRRNIWTSLPDVIASIANYMVENGWQTDQPWSKQVKLPHNFDDRLIGYKVTKPVQVWLEMGIQPLSNLQVDDNTSASIIHPHGGPSFMIFKNFKVILKYNRSTFYAGAISYLANEICRYPH